MTKNQFRTDAEKYLAEIRGNYKESTFNEKRRKLNYFSDLLYQLHEDRKISSSNPRKMTKEDVNAYVTFRRGCGIEDSTIAKDLSLIGELLKFVGNDAMEMYKAIYGNKKPRNYQGRKAALPDEVIEKVYALARSTTDWTMLEGCLTVILGCAAGLRPQEARQLYVEDVHHLDPEPYILIKHVKGEGKWGRVRVAPLNDGVSDIFEKFIRMREEKLQYHRRKSTAFFPTFRSDKEFIAQQSMSKLKDRVQKTLGVKFHLKDARRSYGQRMLDRGVPIEFVSHSLGHSSVATTQKYYADYRDRAVLSQVHGILNGWVQPQHQ